MGYRSDVAYTIRFNSNDDELNKQSFYTFLAEAKSKEEYTMALDDVCMRIDEARYCFNFYTNDVKWYENYDDVISHTALFDLAKEWESSEATPCIGYMFVRVGEEPSDIEELSGGLQDYDWIRVSRQVNCDWD